MFLKNVSTRGHNIKPAWDAGDPRLTVGALTAPGVPAFPDGDPRRNTGAGALLAPGHILEVPDDQGRALIAATRGKNASPQSGELIEVGGRTADVDNAPAPGLASMSEEKAVALVEKAAPSSLPILAEGEKRPAVLSAIAKRQRS